MYDPRMAETFRQVSQSVDNVSKQAGLAQSVTQSPPNIRSITVQANSGNHEIALADPEGAAAPSLGIHYFVDHDTTPAFANATTIHLGPSRNAFVNLGSQTVYWRAYSQYRNGPKSAYMVWGGSKPTSLNASGSPTVARLASQGSGGNGGGGGFGQS